MTPACRSIQPLLSLRAAGALAEDDAAAVEAHLAGCPACRAEADADAEVLGLAALPPIAEAEQAALADLPARTLHALRARSSRRLRLRKFLTAGAIAAAAVLALASPALLRGRAPGGSRGPATGERAWQEPDVEALWNESEVLTAAADPSQQAADDDYALAAMDSVDDE